MRMIRQEITDFNLKNKINLLQEQNLEKRLKEVALIIKINKQKNSYQIVKKRLFNQIKKRLTSKF